MVEEPSGEIQAPEVEPLVTKGRLRSMVGVVVAVLVVGVGAGWAAAEVFAPQPPIDDAAFTVVTVTQGSVEASQAVNARAVWPRTLAAANAAVGTVTSVEAHGSARVDAGAVLYSVDLRPVVVLQGAVPAFRDMAEGAAGADVAQLQAFLSAAGYLQSFEPGRWDYLTTQAVRAWQEAAGMEADGIVGVGDIVFVPSLPSGIALDAEVVRLGAKLSGGEDAVFQLADRPSFELPVSDAQAATLPLGSRVEITAPDDEIWTAWITDQASAGDEGGTNLILSSSADGGDDSAICKEHCGQIQTIPEGVLLRSRVVTVDEVKGLVVPSAAVATTADGSSVVIEEDGTIHRVSILAGARGSTVVEGVEEGTRLRAPAEVR